MKLKLLGYERIILCFVAVLKSLKCAGGWEGKQTKRHALCTYPGYLHTYYTHTSIINIRVVSPYTKHKHFPVSPRKIRSTFWT